MKKLEMETSKALILIVISETYTYFASKMKIAILYHSSPSGKYIVSQLHSKYPNAFFIEEKHSLVESFLRVIKRKSISFFKKLDMIAFCSFYILFMHRKVNRILYKYFGKHSVPTAKLYTNNINQAHVHEAIQSFNPDVVFVVGTRVLEKKWLELNIPIINVHSGILPKYRGRFCWLWSIMNEDKKNIGVTAHYISHKVDTGKIIVQEYIGELENYAIASLLNAVSRCSLSVIEQTIDKLKANSPIRHHLILEKSIAPMYFEPGFTDFFRYLKNRNKS